MAYNIRPSEFKRSLNRTWTSCCVAANDQYTEVLPLTKHKDDGISFISIAGNRQLYSHFLNYFPVISKSEIKIMPGIVCLDDTTTHGGKVITAISTLFISGIQVALVGDLISCPKRGVNPIRKGGPTAAEKGRNVVVNHCQCACDYKVISSQLENNIGS